MHRRVLDLGVSVNLGCEVFQYREHEGSVVLTDGSVFQGDLVVAADGMLCIIYADYGHEGLVTDIFVQAYTQQLVPRSTDPLPMRPNTTASQHIEPLLMLER